MAKLFLYRDQLRHNFEFLKEKFQENEVEWAVVTKLLCGNKEYLKEVLELGPKQVCDSRIPNLKIIKELKPEIETVYIKSAAKSIIKRLVRYADVSFNTEISTIESISREAVLQGKHHKIVIMTELGDLREGVLFSELEDFYERILELPNIEVIGIGANLNCLHGVMPSREKLISLANAKKKLEEKFKIKLPFVSGGTTVTLPMLFEEDFPKEVNHFRVGEALFFGADLFNEKTIGGMYPFTFELEAQIIEVSEKPTVPYGEMRENPMGIRYEKKSGASQTAMRAILDIGVLDVQEKFLIPKNENVKFIGSSSDMMVVDITDSKHKYPVGSTMKFQLKYMGALSLLNSRYIDKVVL